MVDVVGLEPTTFRVWGERSEPTELNVQFIFLIQRIVGTAKSAYERFFWDVADFGIPTALSVAKGVGITARRRLPGGS